MWLLLTSILVTACDKDVFVAVPIVDEENEDIVIPDEKKIMFETRQFKVLGLNIKGLPFTKDDGRYKEIARQINVRLAAGDGPDFVLLQEDPH